MNLPKLKRNMRVDDAGVAGRTRTRTQYLHNVDEEGEKVLKSYVPDVYNTDGKIIGKYKENDDKR